MYGKINMLAIVSNNALKNIKNMTNHVKDFALPVKLLKYINMILNTDTN